MPKKVKQIIALSLSAVLLFTLIFKLERTVSNWLGLSELWELGEKAPSMFVLLLAFGDYLLLPVTALSLWLRGAAAIVLGAVGVCGSFALYIFELLVESLFAVFTDIRYSGADPLVTALIHIIALYALVVAIADTVIRRKNKRKGNIML